MDCNQLLLTFGEENIYYQQGKDAWMTHNILLSFHILRDLIERHCSLIYLLLSFCIQHALTYMSTYIKHLQYPLYQRGNPQLRIFLPNFWMKLIRPKPKQLPNIVNFECSMEMTKYDIKNYLEKIYNIPVVDVRTKITLGKFKKDVGKGYVIKDNDMKIAFVTLPKDMTFEFPKLFEKSKDQDEENMKSLDEAKKSFKSYIDRNKDRSDVPSWFSI